MLMQEKVTAPQGGRRARPGIQPPPAAQGAVTSLMGCPSTPTGSSSRIRAACPAAGCPQAPTAGERKERATRRVGTVQTQQGLVDAGLSDAQCACRGPWANVALLVPGASEGWGLCVARRDGEERWLRAPGRPAWRSWKSTLGRADELGLTTSLFLGSFSIRSLMPRAVGITSGVQGRGEPGIRPALSGGA